MNKQEVIKELNAKKDKNENVFEIEDYDTGFKCGTREAYGNAIYIVKQLDEPEKPVLSKDEAEWVEGLKEEQERRPFWTKYSTLYFITRCGFGYGFSYDHKGREIELKHYPHEIHVEKERLVNAILYGYEIEKEKLYTAKLKLTNEYLHYDEEYKKLHHYDVPDDIANEIKGYHFTEDDLVKYHIWGNNAYEVNEVK